MSLWIYSRDSPLWAICLPGDNWQCLKTFLVVNSFGGQWGQGCRPASCSAEKVLTTRGGPALSRRAQTLQSAGLLPLFFSVHPPGWRSGLWRLPHGPSASGPACALIALCPLGPEVRVRLGLSLQRALFSSCCPHQHSLPPATCRGPSAPPRSTAMGGGLHCVYFFF